MIRIVSSLTLMSAADVFLACSLQAWTQQGAQARTSQTEAMSLTPGRKPHCNPALPSVTLLVCQAQILQNTFPPIIPPASLTCRAQAHASALHGISPWGPRPCPQARACALRPPGAPSPRPTHGPETGRPSRSAAAAAGCCAPGSASRLGCVCRAPCASAPPPPASAPDTPPPPPPKSTTTRRSTSKKVCLRQWRERGSTAEQVSLPALVLLLEHPLKDPKS